MYRVASYMALTGESFSPGVSSVKKLRPPPAPVLCRAVDVLDLAARRSAFDDSLLHSEQRNHERP